MEAISEGVRMNARSKYSRVRHTRRIASGLDESFDDLVATAMLFAEISDSADAADRDRIRAGIEWRETVHQISARIVDQSRREDSWASQRPRAV